MYYCGKCGFTTQWPEALRRHECGGLFQQPAALEPPPRPQPDDRRTAYRSSGRRAGKTLATVLRLIDLAGAHGMTSDEIVAATGMEKYTVRPLLSKLELHEGLLYVTGTRPSQRECPIPIYFLTPAGRARLKELP